LKDTFNIRKQGHLNKMISAIRKLQYPNQGKWAILGKRVPFFLPSALKNCYISSLIITLARH